MLDEKEKRKQKNLEKKKAQFQNMLLDTTKGKGKDTLGGNISIPGNDNNKGNEQTIKKLTDNATKVYLTSRRDVIPIEINLIDVNPLNKEFFSSLSENEWINFIEDIDSRGIIQPLIAYFENRTSRWILIDGEQRYRAARELGIKNVPVQVTDKPIDKEAERQFLIKANLLRRQLSKEQRLMLYKALSKTERLNFYLEKYGKKRILEEQRGGDTKSKKAKSKSSTDNFDSQETLKNEILKDTLLPEGTVNRDLAELRKKLKSKSNKKQIETFDLNTKQKLAKAEKEISHLTEKIELEETLYQKKIKDIKQKKNAKIKKLKEQIKLKEKEIKKLLV